MRIDSDRLMKIMRMPREELVKELGEVGKKTREENKRLLEYIEEAEKEIAERRTRGDHGIVFRSEREVERFVAENRAYALRTANLNVGSYS